MKAAAYGLGFPNTDNMGDVQKYAKDHDMTELLKKHAAADDPFHIRMHDMFVIGKNFAAASLDFSLYFSNVWFLLTVFRVMISGWGLNVFTDLFHRFCTAKVKMICYGVCSIGYRLNPLMFGTIPDSHGESEEMYTVTFAVFLSALKSFVTNFKRCGLSACLTCKNIMDILDHPTIKSFISSRDWQCPSIKLPIRSFSSDNSGGFLKFVRKNWPDGSVHALICAAHLNGKYVVWFHILRYLTSCW
jgi:hypothetical protein